MAEWVSAACRWLLLPSLLVLLPIASSYGASDKAATKATTGAPVVAEEEPPRKGLFERWRERRDARKYEHLKKSLDKYNEPINADQAARSATEPEDQSGEDAAGDSASTSTAEP